MTEEEAIDLVRELVFLTEEEAHMKLQELLPGATLAMSGPNATVTLADGRVITLEAA